MDSWDGLYVHGTKNGRSDGISERGCRSRVAMSWIFVLLLTVGLASGRAQAVSTTPNFGNRCRCDDLSGKNCIG